MSRVAVTLIVCALAVPALAAQSVRDVPARPAMPAGSDTNSAQAYWDFGSGRLRTNPSEAAAAFYWASRLNPEAAEYYYGRRVALMLTDPRRLVRYYSYDRPTLRDPEVIAIDSLLLRARMINPFYHERLDEVLWIEIIKAEYAQLIRQSGGWFEDAELERFVRDVAQSSPSLAARMSYARGQLAQALDYLNRSARSNRRNPAIRAERAKMFFLIGSFDSARVEMTQALQIARRRDADTAWFFYESKAAWEFSLGRIHEQMRNVDAARDAYEQTLTEELSYYPAHIRLGMVHIARGDTAAALREFGRAVAVKDNEYTPHATLGYFLAVSGRYDSAAVHFRRAGEIEPHAAYPRLMLGSVLDAAGNAAGALAAFQAFVERAPRADQDLPTIRNRIAALRGARE